MIRHILILAVSIGLPIWISVMANPTFWAAIPFGNKYVGVIKIALGVATFITLYLLTRKK